MYDEYTMPVPGDEEMKSYYALLSDARGEYRAMEKLWKQYGSWGNALAATRVISPHDVSWNALQEHGIALHLPTQASFPSLLHEMPWRPFGLFVKGTLSEGERRIAIVGTRRATPEGKLLARRFAETFAAAGVTVVSGLAFGIDAAAHEGALQRGGKTYAVLACGLDTVYPRSHTSLAARILEGGGALVSEYPLGTPPVARRFLERNRIISGLAEATVVIEAPQASGALATARFAVDQNREVFVVPGPALSDRYHGSHTLLKSGAALATKGEDVLEALGISSELRASGTAPLLPNVDKLGQSVMTILQRAGKGLTPDAIAEETGAEPMLVNRTLAMLLLMRYVEERGGKYIAL